MPRSPQRARYPCPFIPPDKSTMYQDKDCHAVLLLYRLKPESVSSVLAEHEASRRLIARRFRTQPINVGHSFRFSLKALCHPGAPRVGCRAGTAAQLGEPG